MLTTQWQKSSWSNGSGGNNCVEARMAVGTTLEKPGTIVEVRDSKNPGGVVLQFTRDEWSAFMGGAAAGEFDLRA